MNRQVAAIGALLVLLAGAVGCKDSPHDDHDHEATPKKEAGHTEEHNEDRTIRVSTSAVERSGIRLEKAVEMPLGGGVRVPAEVRPDPDRVVHVASIVEGQIAEVRVSIGDQVQPGDVLAVLRSVALGETRAAMSEAQAELAVAQSNYQRQQNLVKEGIGAQRNLIAAEGKLQTARARVAGLRDRTRVYGRGGSGATTLLRSTIDGQVAERHATVGEVVGPDKTLFVVVDTSAVWVVGAVYPQDIEAVRQGVQVTFTASDLPGRSWRGSLDWVSPMIDERTRTLPVRLILENPQQTLRPGLFGTLRVPRDGEKTVLTIADTALQELEGAQVVFVPSHEAGEFEIRPVTIGRQDDGRVEIVEGLKTGDSYVSEGTFVLKSQLLRGELGEGHAH